LINEPSREVFLILDGEIAVTKERKKVYTEEVLEGKTMARMKAGISFGELGVLYETQR
jgi:CRP-like cAMP-binding protein